MKRLPQVSVLMSTYNGERFLRHQIDTILAQEGVEVRLLVRDDGSGDGTQHLLEEYKEKGLLDWYTGGNLGPARSFMHLLAEAPPAGFYAFADQDDHWLPDKLAAAVEHLGQTERPALCFCPVQPVDEALQPLLAAPAPQPQLTYGEALVYQFVNGCAMVFNAALRTIALRYEPAELAMHDLWLYALCHAVGGQVYYDATPRLYYRQHAANVVGQGSALTLWKRRIARLRSGSQMRYRLALELQRGYAEQMTPEARALTADFVAAKHSLTKRLRLMRDKRLATASPATSRFFRLALLMNTY